MSQLKLEKAKISKLDYIAHASVWLSNHTHKCTIYLHTNYYNTTKHNKYLPQLELLWSSGILIANKRIPKYTTFHLAYNILMCVCVCMYLYGKMILYCKMIFLEVHFA